MATAYHMEALRKQRILERAVEAKQRMQEEEAIAGAEEKAKAEKRKKHRHHHHKRSNRPASAQKVSSTPKKSKTAHSPSPTSYRMETSPPPPPAGKASPDGHSKKTSRCSTASKATNGQHSRPISATSLQPKANANSTTTTAEQSRASSSVKGVASGCESQTETIIVSRCSKCRSVVSSSASQHAQQSRSASRSSVGGRTTSRSMTSSVQSGSRISSTLDSERRRSLEKRAELKAEAVRNDLHQQELVLRDSNLVMGSIPVEEEMKLRAFEQQKLDEIS